MFKDLLPTASYGFILYAQSHLMKPIAKVLEFRKEMSMGDKERFLFSDSPDANMVQMGKSVYRMAAESLKFATESMALHPYQRI